MKVAHQHHQRWFNRSLGALSDMGVINEKKLRAKYHGIGSEYYDRVTVQIELTARYAAPAILELFLAKDGQAERTFVGEPVAVTQRKPWWRLW